MVTSAKTMPLTIAPKTDIYTLINMFSISPERQRELVASLVAITETFTNSQPGFIGAAVHASYDGTRVANYVQWQSKEDFRAVFEHPRMQSHMEEVSELAESVKPVFYSVEYSSS